MQHVPFRPERAILDLDSRFHAVVEPASFSEHKLRWRNQRWAERVGLGALDDDAWTSHFGRFEPLDGSLDRPLALAYHGHQFGVYNPQLGDGRGFLFGQLRDGAGRLLDLGTKGSGQTPWSRSGDGRLTLKGGVREVLAAQLLEALGVYTSKAFSLFETGEALHRNDEPSPTRSSVLVRLSHSHVRFGSFQRLAHIEDAEGVALLASYCGRRLIETGTADAPTQSPASSAAAVFETVTAATADLAASWMAAGFVHGVLNTDNMVVTGESFDYGPWRFLPYADPNFIAAYFDETGLYRFGRQPTTAAWNLTQLAAAISLVTDAAPLEASLRAYTVHYQRAFQRRCFSILGLAPGDAEADLDLLKRLFGWMTATRAPWRQVFHDWFCGAASERRAMAGPLGALYLAPDFTEVRSALTARTPVRPDRASHPVFQETSPVDLYLETVEAIWEPIAARDDWSKFETILQRISAERDARDAPHEAETLPRRSF
ncbi:YdiU family protein [bacterium]|nr:YdiU family protein [bacterium]